MQSETQLKQNTMETNIKEQLVKAIDNIKNKIQTIKNEEDAAHLKFKKVFKPITDPLKAMTNWSEKDNHSARRNSFQNSYSVASSNFSSDYEESKDLTKTDSNEDSEYYDYADDDDEMKPSEKSIDDTLISIKKEDLLDIYTNINVPFGIRSENSKFMMGDSAVRFSSIKDASNREKSFVVTINNKNYNLTPGLRELLLRNKPNFQLITENDKINYKDMLDRTNAHKRDFNPDSQTKGDKGLKYRKIIKPLFSQSNKQQVEKKVGGYLPKLKTYKKNTDFIYWDDPNELIERLKLLIASKSAGNSSHDNEIVSIIEELREAGIIKE